MGSGKLNSGAHTATRHVLKEGPFEIIRSKLGPGEVHEVKHREADQGQKSHRNDEDRERTTIEEVAIESAFVFLSGFLGKSWSCCEKSKSGADKPSFSGVEL